ncbi:MAG TPA: dihydrodipicolinate synthase family protein [Actinomycetota bacterium]|nr:dihydrodipicolinate synthase family protein [Actinomycetota bacterium]
MAKLHGAIAAAVTPLRDAGLHLDEPSAERLVRFLADGGVDGTLVAGTTGEGVLLSVPERMRLTELFVDARPDGFSVAVHAGAQTTTDTVALAAHAQEHGADAVAVIAPPYFPLDGDELFAHLRGAASAADPLPFYVYEFAGRSGYAIPVEVIHRLRASSPNLAGLKVSDTPFTAVEPYLIPGLDVFIGSEPLVLEGMRRGAAGSVSGLATAWPDMVAALVHDRDDAAHADVCALRDALAGLPFHAALKTVLVERGILGQADVRAPLRGLTPDESRSVARMR